MLTDLQNPSSSTVFLPPTTFFLSPTFSFPLPFFCLVRSRPLVSPVAGSLPLYIPDPLPDPSYRVSPVARFSHVCSIHCQVWVSDPYTPHLRVKLAPCG
ncbi:hypothetical protein TNCT_293781 [Trichonephila clavata]|uniref:Uncharacterized protein n=1 Tax=Trichonephila clavata TaxID=2740835 RepID=A0A8X6GCU5_TRICU|nr:hypothetical protein TNCT_293781 [Trichonephila clavata]